MKTLVNEEIMKVVQTSDKDEVIGRLIDNWVHLGTIKKGDEVIHCLGKYLSNTEIISI